MSNKELFKIKKKQVEDYRASSLTAKEWCEKNGMKLSNLRYWVTKLNRMNQAPTKPANGFVEFRLPPVKANPIIIKCGTFIIEVDSGSDTETLERVIGILGKAR